MPHSANSLPPNTVLEGYQIVSLLETTELFHLYLAMSPQGSQVFIREFCPHDCTKRMEDGIRLAFNKTMAPQLAEARNLFHSLYAAGARETSSHGTILYISDAPTPAQETAIPSPAVHQSLQSKPVLQRHNTSGTPVRPLPPVTYKHKKSGSGFLPIIIVLFLAIAGFIGYKMMDKPDTAPAVVKTTPKPPPQKPKQVPVAVHEPEPVVEEPEPEPEPQPEPEPEPVVVAEPEPDLSPSPELQQLRKNVMTAVAKSKGVMNEAVLHAYTAFAEKSVREYLAKRKAAFSPAFEKWLSTTKNNKEIFANFYPPDPSVATNADILINAVGEQAYQYDQLVIAFAVGRRFCGMGEVFYNVQYNMGEAGLNIRSTLPPSPQWPSPADVFIAGIPPINYYGPNPDSGSPEQYETIKNYLTSKNITAKQAWISQENTVKDLADKGITKDNILGALKSYMVRSGQIKSKRDAFPSPVEFFKYLVAKYEGINKMRDVKNHPVEWDGVPLDFTPWLAMLPLSETRPIRECEYVWDRYLGKYGDNRLWRYGPYRKVSDPEPPALFSMDPNPDWSYMSYPGLIHIGGMCGTMSTIARTSHIAMGSPASPAGQPIHANLMTYHYGAGGSILSIDQSVSPLKKTFGAQYLCDNEGPRNNCGEYHVGLAASMNLKDGAWTDSRLAMNIYKMGLEEKAPEELQKAMLSEILKINPFYTEAWYALFEKEGGDIKAAMTCIDTINKAIPPGERVASLWQRMKSSPRMGKAPKNYKQRLNNQAHEYTDTLGSAMLELAADKPLPNFTKSEWGKIMDWMRSEAKNSSYPEKEQGYQVALAMTQGFKPIVNSIDSGFKEIVRFYKSTSKKKKELKTTPEQLTLEVNAAVMVMPKTDAVPWLKNMIENCPDELLFTLKDDKAKITDFYDSLTKHYLKLADSSGASEVRALMQRQEEAFLKGNKEKQKS